MLKPRMQDALNEQINKEYYSAYLYLSMSSYFESVNLSGFAKWMNAQYQEEIQHVLKFFRYIVERGGRVLLQPIEGPPTEWDSPLAAFEAAYGHEVLVTGLINDLVDLAVAEYDHATNNFLQWFIEEQVEEEASTDGVVQQLKLAGDGGGLFLLDRELGQRVFTPPAGDTSA